MLGDELVPGMEKLRVQLVSGGQPQDCHSEAGAEESHRICTAVVQRKETLLLPGRISVTDVGFAWSRADRE